MHKPERATFDQGATVRAKNALNEGRGFRRGRARGETVADHKVPQELEEFEREPPQG